MEQKLINKVNKLFYYLFNKYSYGSLGFRSYIRSPILICNKKNIFIGKSVNIQKNARIEPITKWGNCKFNPMIKISDKVSIEQGLHLTCANCIEIGKGTAITPYVVITDIKHDYKEISKPILEQGIKAFPVKIGENCFIGAGAKIMPGTTLGNHCIVATNAVVFGTFEDYSVIAGNPARMIKKYDIDSNQWIRVTE